MFWLFQHSNIISDPDDIADSIADICWILLMVLLISDTDDNPWIVQNSRIKSELTFVLEFWFNFPYLQFIYWLFHVYKHWKGQVNGHTPIWPPFLIFATSFMLSPLTIPTSFLYNSQVILSSVPKFNTNFLKNFNYYILLVAVECFLHAYKSR